MKVLSKEGTYAVRKYRNVQAQIKRLEKEKDALKATIVAEMEGHGAAECKIGGMVVTLSYKAVTTKKVDPDKVKIAFPDWETRFLKVVTSPRLIVR